MRLLIYNIAYGTGHTGAPYDRLKNAHRLIRTPAHPIAKIADYIESEEPDIVGLIEADSGSSRTKKLNQIELVASKLKHKHVSAVKYNKNHFASLLPIVRFQSNAVLSLSGFSYCDFQFFPVGIKQLIIAVKIGEIFLFLVHLSLRKNIRRRQIEHLAKIAKDKDPCIIAGDFNVFSGAKELEILQKELKLINVNSSSEPTYPAYKPRLELDYILCSHKIKAQAFRVAKVLFSDHLPLIFDFQL